MLLTIVFDSFGEDFVPGGFRAADRQPGRGRDEPQMDAAALTALGTRPGGYVCFCFVPARLGVMPDPNVCLS